MFKILTTYSTMKKIKFLLLPVLAFLLSSHMTFAQLNQGWTNLFDGKSLKGWKPLAGKASFKVEVGAIVGTTVMNAGGNSFLVTEKEYGDFILELDEKIDSTLSNSGIQTRSHLDPQGNKGIGKVYGRQVEI